MQVVLIGIGVLTVSILFYLSYILMKEE